MAQFDVSQIVSFDTFESTICSLNKSEKKIHDEELQNAINKNLTQFRQIINTAIIKTLEQAIKEKQLFANCATVSISLSMIPSLGFKDYIKQDYLSFIDQAMEPFQRAGWQHVYSYSVSRPEISFYLTKQKIILFS